MDEEQEALHTLYRWLDTIPLPSLPKKSGILSRDFSDATCVADIIHYYNPKIIDVHNYTRTCNTEQKRSNWETLERKVLKKHLGITLKGRYAELCASTGGRNRYLEELLYTLMVLFEDSAQREFGTDGVVQCVDIHVEEEGNTDDDGEEQKENYVQHLKETIRLLEDTCRKQDGIIRLQQAKIEVLSERLQQQE